MKDVARMALQKGMILAEDITGHDNQVIFPKGTEVDEQVIAKLARHSIMVVRIMEKIDFATTHFEKVRISEGFLRFQNAYNICFEEFKHRMSMLVTHQVAIDPVFLLNIHHTISSVVPSSTQLLDYLYNMIPNEETLTYAHFLNSALIAGVFADWMSLSPAEKGILILSAFYYDVGKLKIPENILWKSERLTFEEYTLIRQHTVFGYEMLKDMRLDKHIINSILMHHERCDGTGYPNRLKKEDIDVYPKFIAIIDAYEAMTSPRTYRQSLTPLQVIDKFEKEGYQKYDEFLLRAILKRIADSQIGLMVKLSDESIWEIFVINPAALSRPILKRNNNEFLDLSTRPDLQISSIH